MRPQVWLFCGWCALLVIGGLAPRILDAAEPMFHLYTEENPPITFSQDGKPAGLGIEVVEEILRRADMPASIEVVPWARGYSYATTLPRVGLFVTTQTAERAPLFKWVGPISVVHGWLYALRDGGVRLGSLEDARTLETIAVPREWYLDQILSRQGFTNLQRTPDLAAAIKLLIGHHAQAIAMDDVTLEAASQKAGVKSSLFEPIVPLADAPQFLVLSLDTPDDTVERCQKALDAMKLDGSFAGIYRRWLPGAEPPGVSKAP